LTDFDDFLASLNPKTASSFRKASTIEYEQLATPSLGINMAMDGIGYGRFTTLYGNKGSGKTTFALGLIAEAQKQGKICAWLDVEKNFNPTWAERNGINIDQLAVASNIISIASFANESIDLVTKGADVLVVDSISQLLPQSFFEDAKSGKEELTSLEKTGQIGTFSKNLGSAINMLNAVNQKCAIVLISQVRNQFTSYGASKTYMGGMALEHANSTVLKFWRTPSDVLEMDVAVGDLILKKPVGAPINWMIEKNRGPGMGWSNKYNLYTGGPFVGIDLAGEILTYGIEFGVIKKGGAWFTIGDEKIQGEIAAAKYLRENPDIMQDFYEKIMARSAL
jgi:recombination protein RecA